MGEGENGNLPIMFDTIKDYSIIIPYPLLHGAVSKVFLTAKCSKDCARHAKIKH
jgi:hypothetical protein